MVGGAEIAIKEITDRLLGEYTFDLICARMRRELPRHERIGAIEVYRVGFGVPLLDKLLLPFLGARMARSLGRQHPYACYWGMMAAWGSMAAYAANLLPGRDVPVVLTLQEGDTIAGRKLGLVAMGWRWMLARTARLTAISTYLGELAKRYGYRGEAVLIPNGVDVARFSAPVPESEAIATKRELGKGMGDVFLVTTSRLVTKNAADTVIEALALLPANVHFIVVGTGPDEQMLRALAKKRGVADRVQFLGHKGHADLPRYLAACDIFIRPSRSEGMGNSFIEAMAAGLPVIATQEGGIADFLFDRARDPEKPTTGFAVGKDSPEEIAEAVRAVMADPEAAQAIAATARAMAAEKYDWDEIALAMQEQAFEPVLARSSPAR